MINNIRFCDRALYDLRKHAKLSIRLTAINDLEFAHVFYLSVAVFLRFIHRWVWISFFGRVYFTIFFKSVFKIAMTDKRLFEHFNFARIAVDILNLLTAKLN